MLSQNNMETYLGMVFGDRQGTFLEIGAWDGQIISQTAWFEKNKGWKGLCVDPFPRNFEKRTCKVCSMAISKDGQPREFVKVTIDRRYGGDVSYFSGFRDSLTEHWDLIHDHCDYTIVTVPTITMASLYKTYKLPSHIDFLSVDVEGAEAEVLMNIDWTIWSYGMICFENNLNEQLRLGIDAMLRAHGYIPYMQLRIDSIYVNDNFQP